MDEAMKQFLVTVLAQPHEGVPIGNLRRFGDDVCDAAHRDGYILVADRDDLTVVVLTDEGRRLASKAAVEGTQQAEDDAPVVGRQRRTQAIARFDQVYGPQLAMAKFLAAHPAQADVSRLDDMTPEAKQALIGVSRARLELEELSRDELMYVLLYALEYAADVETKAAASRS